MPLLNFLHWVPVINKILVHPYKTLNGSAPRYWEELIFLISQHDASYLIISTTGMFCALTNIKCQNTFKLERECEK